MKYYVAKYVLILLLISGTVISQDTNRKESGILFQSESRRKTNETVKTKFELSKTEKYKRENNTNDFAFKFFRYETKKRTSFNFLSSVNSNISFGGFWDKYAVLNFTPQVNIKPLKFINIYANRYLSCFVPMSGLKENITDLILEGISIMAIDNSSKLFFKEPTWISEIIVFTAKNILLNLMIKPSAKKSDTPFYENYFYSVSISF